MSDQLARSPDTGVWLRLACLCGALLALAGCGSLPGTQAASGPDIMTASDEPEARRRARIRMELAVGYFEQGQVNVALDEVKQVLASDPGFADAHNLRGLIYMRLNDMRLAEESFRRAVALDPRNSSTQHNLGWLQCQQNRYPESLLTFKQVLANPLYTGQAKTWMAQGLCQARAGRMAEAETSLAHAYELDAGNPITGYNLANLLFQRGELTRSQFYIRRLNNSDLANAETLWLGVRVERRLNDRVAMAQLGEQLKKRFPRSTQSASFERGAFDE